MSELVLTLARLLAALLLAELPHLGEESAYQTALHLAERLAARLGLDAPPDPEEPDAWHARADDPSTLARVLEEHLLLEADQAAEQARAPEPLTLSPTLATPRAALSSEAEASARALVSLYQAGSFVVPPKLAGALDALTAALGNAGEPEAESLVFAQTDPAPPRALDTPTEPATPEAKRRT